MTLSPFAIRAAIARGRLLRAGAALQLGALLLTLGCQGGLSDPAPLAQLDEPYFRCRVQPILTKSCAAFACHGSAGRYYTLFGRNRLRFGGDEQDRGAAMRDIERAFNFDASRSYANLADPDASLLLRKPLDEKAGGYYHNGAEIYGKGDVFLSEEDADYQLLRQWLGGASDDASCIEPGSDQ